MPCALEASKILSFFSFSFFLFFYYCCVVMVCLVVQYHYNVTDNGAQEESGIGGLRCVL